MICFLFSYSRSNFYDSCDHEKIKSADVCIADVIGQINPEHFFVATQDSDLRKKFQEVNNFFSSGWDSLRVLHFLSYSSCTAFICCAQQMANCSL